MVIVAQNDNRGSRRILFLDLGFNAGYVFLCGSFSTTILEMGDWLAISLLSGFICLKYARHKLGGENFHRKTQNQKGEKMARVTAVTIRVGDFDLSFVGKPRKTGNSVTPFLVGTVDHGSCVQDPDRRISKEAKAKAYKLAAVILNKFSM